MRKLSIAIILIVVLSLSACVGVAKEKTIKIEPIRGANHKIDVRWYDNGEESFMVWVRCHVARSERRRGGSAKISMGGNREEVKKGKSGIS